MKGSEDFESPAAIIRDALAVESPIELDLLWDRLKLFAPHDRPVGDRWGNRALLTAAGGKIERMNSWEITVTPSRSTQQAINEWRQTTA